MFVVTGSVTFLYFDLQYRDEFTVWTTRNLISVTGKVQEIILVHTELLDRQKRAKFLL